MRLKLPSGVLKRSILVFGVLYMYLLVFMYIRNHVINKQNVASYEKLLCHAHATADIEVKILQKKCPDRKMVTSYVRGGLENNMWQYANILAISRACHLEGYVPTCLKQTLETVFTNLSLPPLSELAGLELPTLNLAQGVRDFSEDFTVIRTSEVYEETIFNSLSVIRSNFILRQKLSRFADNVLRMAVRMSPNVSFSKNMTYVGVLLSSNNSGNKTRPQMSPSHPDVKFLLRAMEWFRREYKDPFFIVLATREDTFWYGLLYKKRAFVVSDTFSLQPKIALAVLAKCKHSIVMDGGLGVWGAILSGGRAIVYNPLSEKLSTLMRIFGKEIFLSI